MTIMTTPEFDVSPVGRSFAPPASAGGIAVAAPAAPAAAATGAARVLAAVCQPHFRLAPLAYCSCRRGHGRWPRRPKALLLLLLRNLIHIHGDCEKLKCVIASRREGGEQGEQVTLALQVCVTLSGSGLNPRRTLKGPMSTKRLCRSALRTNERARVACLLPPRQLRKRESMYT